MLFRGVYFGKGGRTILQILSRQLSRKANPGLNYQISAIEDVMKDIENNPEGFGDLESDLSNVHKLHKEYEQEEKLKKDMVRKYVVKSKYFRDQKYPNFLTYAEKENIRLLHNKNPEQWSIEVLSESFPANSDAIKKILKADWKPRSVSAHDAAVFRNWEKLRKGEIKLPADLEHHLKKFCNRKLITSTHLPESSSMLVTRTEVRTPSSTEFSSIVMGKGTKSIPVKNRTRQCVDEIDDETFLLDKVAIKKHMRASDIKEIRGVEILSNPDTLDLGKDVTKNTSQTSTNMNNRVYDIKDMHGHNTLSNPGTSNFDITKNSSQTSNDMNNVDSPSLADKFTSTEVEVCDADKKRFEMSRVKPKIHIPRKLYRKGATYRVDDTYYDDDGEFLYRVPGMMGFTPN
ncbi:uncharacterized protein LOC133328437 [Musca vetustissima]|uniref:uncharacterized protein LOC133328437 n=1 Tax=Musca vetustissima TaxID=27455 RepID=UPI002AB74875|nr:uncharacterized protein LOC133328437 [Musca vetustissima]